MGAMDERSNVTSMVQLPTSRFTAVNSTNDPLQAGGRAVMNNVNIIASGRERHEKSSGQQRFAQGTQEKIPIMTISANQHENWARLDKTRERNFSILPNPSSNANVIPIPHVNKQLKPEEIDKRPPSNSMGPNLYHQHPLPPSAPLKFNAESGTSDADLAQEENLRQQLQAGSRETYTPPGPQFRHAMKPNEERESTQDSEKWGIGEVLHRASGGLEVHGPQQPNFRAPSSSQDPVSQYSQGESKKRKRNFSNRTKTGCMTCRRRKKKCDETKPECNNCLRGGFTCSGYQQRVPWLKPESNQGPIPLQSKKEYENSPYSTTKPYPTTSVVASPRNESASTFRGQALRIEQQYMRPLGVNSDQRIAPISPTSVLRIASENQNISSNPCTQPAEVRVMATNSAYPDHHSKKVHDRKHDETRQAMHRPDPEMNTTPSVKNPPPSNSQTRGALEDPLSSAQQAAQLALLNLASTTRRSRLPNDEILPGRPTQKEEMLAGRNYYPSDTQLVLERESCISACWRFNNSANPNYQVSPDERARLFRDILHAHEHVITPNQTSPVNPSGSIGENVVVDIPFYCDYGYNISIGQDVVIGRNCTIIDSCEVSIGDRCHLGPNVSLYTETLPIDPKRRLGSRGPHTGREIVIQSDCWIGGNVIILPGRTIGKGATVGAGSVVTRDIPSYTVACGNPARILRGVANND